MRYFLKLMVLLLTVQLSLTAAASDEAHLILDIAANVKKDRKTERIEVLVPVNTTEGA